MAFSTPGIPVPDQTLGELDPEVAAAVDAELGRQRDTLEMIASENFAPQAVLEAQGTVLTNKYAEGYPGRRYYGGCEWVDVAEQLAIDRCKLLFGADHANVQPHSGASANIAAYFAVCDPGDKVLALSLPHGGHLTHGHKVNFSGTWFDVASYEVRRDTETIDMDQVRDRALEHRPKLIIAGWSAYPRQLDFEAFRSIADEVRAVLLCDAAHFIGLVAGGVHPSPVPYCDIVTFTTHKTLRGPRGAIILTNEEWAKPIDKAVFPGTQGGPLEHVVAAKAVALKEAMEPAFKQYAQRILDDYKQLYAKWDAIVKAAQGDTEKIDQVTWFRNWLAQASSAESGFATLWILSSNALQERPTAALFSTLTAFVRSGDEVPLFQPCYDSYAPVVQLNGGRPVFVTLRFPDYAIDWDEVRRAISPRTRLLVLNSPHNPTGMMLTADDIRELKRVLEGTDALVVSDEVYEHIIFDGRRHESLARDPDLAARSVVISSFGKTYHTTGWKVGYAAAPKPLTAEIQRVHQFVTFTVNGAIQMAYAEFVNRDPLCADLARFYQAKRDLFLRLIERSRFRPLPCRGTYFQLLDYSAIAADHDTAAHRLALRGLAAADLLGDEGLVGLLLPALALRQLVVSPWLGSQRLFPQGRKQSDGHVALVSLVSHRPSLSHEPQSMGQLAASSFSVLSSTRSTGAVLSCGTPNCCRMPFSTLRLLMRMRNSPIAISRNTL